ncbi:transposase [Paenibacillus riograndensis SBR5]|uniref:Transposase n=1 Tax=Paenibacillus riograndensis SBR5 TaxID=1073571 RepID=A0A0E3WGQ4_9BACL|nr:transposase [Paenibacillus riograndensis SBR5]
MKRYLQPCFSLPKNKPLKKAVRMLRKDLLQIGTENQFILAYSLHQRPTDTRCLEPHMEKVQQILGQLPKTVIADAGYGSEENYAYLEKKEIQAVVKYGSYHKEKSKAWKANVGKIEYWTYNTAEDHWTCPAGKCIWTTEEQPGVPAISASRHGESDARSRLAFARP